MKIVKTNYFNNKSDPNAKPNMVRCIVDMPMVGHAQFKRVVEELNTVELMSTPYPVPEGKVRVKFRKLRKYKHIILSDDGLW